LDDASLDDEERAMLEELKGESAKFEGGSAK
jgi:hypothetical protein